jgi:hypothetical protein
MNQLQAISNQTQSFLSNEVNITEYESTVFPVVSKVAKIAQSNFRYFIKADLQKFIEDCATKYAMAEGYTNQLERYGRYTNEKYLLPNKEEVSTDEVESEIIKFHTLTLPKNLVNTSVYNGHFHDDFYIKIATAMITEESAESYGGIPPLQVIQAGNKAKEQNLFDSFVVIDAKNIHKEYKITTKKNIERIEQQRQKMIDDPILCGKINEMPDVYFIIACWDKDVPMSQILLNN